MHGPLNVKYGVPLVRSLNDTTNKKKRALCSQLHNADNEVPKIATTYACINTVKPTGYVMHQQFNIQ